MFKDRARGILHDYLPSWIADRIRSYRLTRRAVTLRRQCQDTTDIDEILATAFRLRYFEPNQIRSEVRALLQEVSRLRPRTLLEIGSQGGGTLFLFCAVAAPDARILSIDLNFSSPQRAAYPSLASPSQHLTCFKADTHDPNTLARVKEWLHGDRLDFLFIDGDHSLSGVSADYQMYAPLVRPGGLIAFHDIVPDHRTRYGRETTADAGEVPIFWRQLKDDHPDYVEFIDDPEQDGCGIGAIRG